MTTVTSVPVGSTGLSLEGLQVGSAIRESVVIADPQTADAFVSQVGSAIRESVVIADPQTADAFVSVVSTQPVNFYGVPVWMQGTPSVSVAALPIVTVQGTSSVNVLNALTTTSVNVLNTLTANVTNVPLVTVQGTSSVNVLNVPTVNVTNVPAVNITTSIPFFVAQSSGPWTISPTGTTMVNIVSTITQNTNITSSIPFFVAQSSAPWTINGSVNVSSQVVASSWPLSTTLVNVVSSIPFFVAQSSAPWIFSEVASTAGGLQTLVLALQATLNTTVVKASAGQIYGIHATNIGSSNVFVRFYAASSAANVIASTAVPVKVFGIPASSSPSINNDMGIACSSGITILTQQQPFTASSSIPPTASTAVITILYK